MRIGIISTVACVRWGGSEELWAATARLALGRGHAVSVCLLRQRGDHPKLDALEGAGAKLFYMPCLGSRLREGIVRRADILVGSGVARQLREVLWPLRNFFRSDPDVVLINGDAIETFGFLQTFRKHIASKPYVALSQLNLAWVPEYRHIKEAARYYREAHRALFVSESGLRTFRYKLLEQLPNGGVVRNPVNLRSLEAVQWPKESTPHFASVARLHCVSKGQDILLQTLSSGPWRSRDWHLSFYGAGPDETYLRELSEHYGLVERVSFCGHTDDIRAAWRTHHTLVLPSRLEGTPLAMVEAMLCGRPVIGSAVAGVPEWVCDGRSGFLASAATAESFADALERAWRRRAEWCTLGEAARRDALARYHPNSADTLLSILIEAAEVKRRVSIEANKARHPLTWSLKNRLKLNQSFPSKPRSTSRTPIAEFSEQRRVVAAAPTRPR